MRSIQKTMLMAGLAAAAVVGTTLAGAARAQAMPPGDDAVVPAPFDSRPDAVRGGEGTLNAQYASLSSNSLGENNSTPSRRRDVRRTRPPSAWPTA